MRRRTGPSHRSTRLGGLDRPLTGTPARYSVSSAARERRADHEQPAAGTSRSTKAGGEPRARRPSGRQDRFAHHAAPLICRAACFQESSRIPTTDARSMCPSIKEASLTCVSPSSRPLLRCCAIAKRPSRSAEIGTLGMSAYVNALGPHRRDLRYVGHATQIQFGCFVPAAIQRRDLHPADPGLRHDQSEEAVADRSSGHHRPTALGPFKRASTIDTAQCGVGAPFEATV
jgi:hypothetical protein